MGGSRTWFTDFEHRLLELRPSWASRHALNQAQATELLNAVPCDGLIFHQDWPQSQEVGGKIADKCDGIFKIQLREESNRANTATASGANHAPAANQGFESAEVAIRSLTVQEWMSQPSTKSLLGQIKKLPTLPRLHLQVTQELQSPNGSLETVSQFVRQDPVMAAKFLQVINSSLFGLAYSISDPGEAVMFLGAIRTRALILMAGVFSQFDDVRCPGFSAEEIWQHSLLVARLAHGVALVQTESPQLAETAFTAGLLHDVGKLVLAGNLPEMYSTAHKLQKLKRIQELEAELAILSTTHAELGGALMGTWRLPLSIVEAVGWHHCPGHSFDQNFSVLTAVHAADVLAYEAAGTNLEVGRPPRFDMMYLVRLGLAGRRNEWREACGLPLRDEEGTLDESARRRSEAKNN